MMNGTKVEDQQKSNVQPIDAIRNDMNYSHNIEYGSGNDKPNTFEEILQSEMDKVEVKKTAELCTAIFTRWFILENKGKDMTQYDEEVAEEFITQVLRQRLQAADIDIVLPDFLTLLIMTCTDGNPGQSLMILNDLLDNIHSRIGSIPQGYIVTSKDFSQTFPSGWPITKIKSVNDYYSQKWAQQKRETKSVLESDNTIDTVGWWRRFVE